MGLAAPPRPTSAGQRPGLPSPRPALSLAPARCLRESRWAAAAEVGRGAAAIQLPSGREQLPTSATGFLAAALDRLACPPRTCAAETGPGSNASDLQSTWCRDSYKPSRPSRPTKERLVSPATPSADSVTARATTARRALPSPGSSRWWCARCALSPGFGTRRPVLFTLRLRRRSVSQFLEENMSAGVLCVTSGGTVLETVWVR